MPHRLMTKQGDALYVAGNTPWNVYPRPQMRRDAWLNLNGKWDLTVSNFPTLPETYDKWILVPFCPESHLSGVKQHFSEGRFLYYRRTFQIPQNWRTGRVLLHIGAADQIAKVYVNDDLLTVHAGGYDAFTVDITDSLYCDSAEVELVICCVDNLRVKSFPYGKQSLTQGGMWYTPVSGIWQTVWAEAVPADYIQKLNIENRDYGVTISTVPACTGKVIVPELGEFPLTDGSVTIQPERPHLWSPETPYLYEFTVETGTDKVASYFVIRSLEVKEIDGRQRLCLNGKPYFFHGLLDQGYWPDGLFTPASPECFAEDILAMKRLGFNTLRNHIKVEPEQFYYDCDRLGMVVFQDMVNNGEYHFFHDTALPGIGFQTLNDKNAHPDPATRQRFLDNMAATVKQLKNHPCICYWTIFNEGWGQFDSDSVYDRLKALDDTRFIDSTSGWFRRAKSDVDSRHVYFKPVKLTAGSKPLVLSEFGGYSYKPKGYVFNTEKTYGYRKFEKPSDYADAVEKLYLEQIVPAYEKGLCAAIYTQVSDVEDETNGVLSYDRKITKLDEKRMLAIAEKLK